MAMLNNQRVIIFNEGDMFIVINCIKTHENYRVVPVPQFGIATLW